MTLEKELAKDFNKDALRQLADHAETCARVTQQYEPKIGRMNEDERAALDDFRQFAAYARRIIEMID